MSVADWIGLGVALLAILGVAALVVAVCRHADAAAKWQAEEIRRINRGDYWRGVNLVPQPQRTEVTHEPAECAECQRSAD